MPLKIISRSFTRSVNACCNRVLNSRSFIGLRSIACRYCTLSTLCQSTTRPRFFLSIISSHIRVARPFPSINGCAIFISTYFAMMSSNVVSGIRSITGKIASRYRALAKRNPPFDILSVRIFPAKSYNPPNNYRCMSQSPLTVPTSIRSIAPDSKRECALLRLWASILSVFPI